MKKTTLLLCLFMVSVLMPQSVWAQSIDVTGTTLTVNSNVAGYLKNETKTDAMKLCTKIVLVGNFSHEDLQTINFSNGFNAVKEVDMTDAVFVKENNYATYYYIASDDADKPSNNIQEGDKCFVGGHLYKLNLSQSYEWELTTYDSSVEYRNFDSYNQMMDNLNEGNIKYAKVDVYHYYRVVNEKVWSAPVSLKPERGQLKAFVDSPSDLPEDLSSYNDDDFIGVVTAGNFYRLDYGKHWVQITEGLDENAIDVTNNPEFENTGYIDGWPKNYPLGTQVWYKKDYQESRTYYVLQEDQNTKSWIYLNNTGEGITSYTTPIDINESNKNEYLYRYSVGDVIRIVTECNYYQVIKEKKWEGPSETGDNNSQIPNFNEADIESNLSSFNENDKVKFFVRTDYYEHLDNSTREWIAYNETPQSVNYSFADVTERDANTASAGDWSIAVVGATKEYSYNNNEWIESTGSSVEYDYSSISFTHWSGTIETAHLPSYVDGAACPVEVLQDCSHLTKLYSNNQYAEVSLSETTATVTATSPGLLKTLLTPTLNATNYPANTVFKFTSGSELNADDIYALATDPAKYYVDLYDISTDSGIERAIAKIQETGESNEDYAARPLGAIDRMRTENKQFKGLLLPKDPSYVGTTLIRDDGQDNVSRATCTEFIAYNNGSTTGMHIYSESKDNPNPTYEVRMDSVVSMMAGHSIADGTTSYFVSTNSPSLIPNVSTKLGSNKTIIETVNNEMVGEATDPSIYVTLANPGDFKSLVENTSIEETPNVQTLQFNGELCFADINAVNSFAAAGGPNVLDLKNVTVSEECPYSLTQILVGLDDNDNVNGLAYAGIDYIILPATGMTKEGVDSIGTKAELSDLKAVISSNTLSDSEPHTLIAYIKVPGSLAEARNLATGRSGEAGPTPQQLTNVILSGKLRNSDILTANGGGLANEGRYVTTIDLGDAVFYDASGNISSTEMNFNLAGFAGPVKTNENEAGDNYRVLYSVILPTSRDMNELSKNCFLGVHSLTELCIPYNYETIHDGALNETGLDHITTTDNYDGVVVDKGPKTYTLSANIKQLGDKPDPKVDPTNNELNGVKEPVFPKNNGVGDLYILATKVPKCYKNVFGRDLTTGYGGQDQTKVYCRERYFNNGEAEKAFVVLHIPNEESFNRAKAADEDNAETDYSTMVNNYTDDTKVYSKLDQTGAVDGDGNPLRWPTHLEMLRVGKQADAGLLWNDWSLGTVMDPDGIKVNDGPLENSDEPFVNTETAFYDYIGWHQIVLCLTSHVDSVEKTKDDVIEHNYVQSGWYTFCIPYNLTYSQVVKMLGIPASTDNVKNYIADDGGEVTKDYMPDIRQLKDVIRKKGSGNDYNVVNFRLTENLYKGGKVTKYLNFTDVDDKHTEMTYEDAGSGDDPVCLVGGRPYYIQPYLPSGVKISKNNLGKYIMTHYADELTMAASCINSGDDYCEKLDIFSYTDRKVTGIDDTADENVKNTMRFAKPYEKHKVQAVTDDDENAGQLVYTTETKSRSQVTHKYYYTMIGQFWEQELPAYCVYMSGQSWYRYGDGSSKFTWAPYKCVIMATPEITCMDDVTDEEVDDAFSKVAPAPTPIEQNITADKLPLDSPTKLLKDENVEYKFDHFGGGFRNIANCYFPMNVPGTKNLIPSPLTLWFCGRDDSSFDNDLSVGPMTKPGSTRYVFSFDEDDDIVELDGQDNETTVIKTLDGAPQLTTGEERVYNLSGQYVGKSTEGLARGIYIIGGRKVVVD